MPRKLFFRPLVVEDKSELMRRQSTEARIARFAYAYGMGAEQFSRLMLSGQGKTFNAANFGKTQTQQVFNDSIAIRHRAARERRAYRSMIGTGWRS